MGRCRGGARFFVEVMWGSPMLLPGTSALSVPLTAGWAMGDGGTWARVGGMEPLNALEEFGFERSFIQRYRKTQPLSFYFYLFAVRVLHPVVSQSFVEGQRA